MKQPLEKSYALMLSVVKCLVPLCELIMFAVWHLQPDDDGDGDGDDCDCDVNGRGLPRWLSALNHC